MADYCEICGQELDPDEKEEGICKKCKAPLNKNEEYESDEEFVDPAVT